jgi:hypothetical protein
VTGLGIACGVLVVVVALLLWERHRADPEVAALIALVDRLCVRIQAPQRAAIEGLGEGEVSAQYAPPAIAPEDDEGYWLSREELAERLARQELNGD